MTMDRQEWIQEASGGTGLTEMQAEALYRRHVAGESRQEAADAMDTSPSSVDNLERTARQKIIRASNLVALAESIGAAPDEVAPIGTCAECDEPTRTLKPHPNDAGPLEDRRLVCSDCHEQLVARNQ